MKVLLLHQQDQFPPPEVPRPWDLVVDLGRSPANVREAWTAAAGIPVVSIYDFAEEVEDLYRTRALLQLGMGRLLDRRKIDWWSVLSPEIVPELQQLMLIRRAASFINRECQIFSSRSDYRATALHELLGGTLVVDETPFQTMIRRVKHYSNMARKFNPSQLLQISQDKFDREHTLRRHLARRPSSSAQPSVLLPSAYKNASQTGLSYAAMLPEEHFVLVCARDNARISSLPPNVEMKSLDTYFSPPDASELSSLMKSWEPVKSHLVAAAPEYRSAFAAGVLDRVPALIRWGIVLRDAWSRLFESETIQSCLCTDHSNPYTKIPLLLAKEAGIPALACHHGALDAWMAITAHDADVYIAKSDMERDYMIRVCEIASRRVVTIPPACHPEPSGSTAMAGPWLIFFSEPYESWSWRKDEVYSELLPRLCSLAETMGLTLVFKLHPFESSQSHRALLLRHLTAEKVREIKVIAGPITGDLWKNATLAITGQSSLALECVARGIPIFLCGWLRDLASGYVRQFQKFGMGVVLETPDQILKIPEFLTVPAKGIEKENAPGELAHHALKELLGSHAVPVSTQS